MSPSQDIRTPGVYVDEITARIQPINGIPTSTAAFVGPTLRGPTGTVPELLTSFAQFEALYGNVSNLTFPGLSAQSISNYMALAVLAFFENGGQQLYVARVIAAKEGTPPAADDYRNALGTLEGLHDVSIIAAPGSTVFGGDAGAHPTPNQAAPIYAELIAHVSRPGAYRFAVLDPPPECSTSDIQAIRSQIDSTNAALYYPWVLIANSQVNLEAPAPITVPPSGFICGIYARVDAQRGVFKAPANEALLGAIGFERTISDSEANMLNGIGINCLRFFPGQGNLVWGARTTSSDPEWKYVNIRRYLTYLERSIDSGTQWVVFEPNDPILWASVTEQINDFLTAEWRKGALVGTKPSDAFFVRCNSSTMTQDDIDNGRLICMIGVAPIRPAEFVIFRIGKFAASSKTL